MFVAVQQGRRPVRHRATRRRNRRATRLYRSQSGRRVFFGPSTRHVRRHSRVVPWLGAAAMMAAMVSWGALLSLLGG